MESESSTREELGAIVTSIKSAQPPVRPKEKRSKMETEHDALVNKMEGRLPAVDEELSRIDRVMKRIQAQEIAKARAAELLEMRETRTRSKKRIDYAAVERGNTGSGEDDNHQVSFARGRSAAAKANVPRFSEWQRAKLVVR